MSKVNIPKSVNDPFYRYKRDQIKVQILNNNGGVTKLTNICEICNQLDVEIKSLLQFFKKKLNVSIIEKDLIIKKIETVDNLEKILEEYIVLNVVCPKCSNPEFSLINEKKSCKACGNIR